MRYGSFSVLTSNQPSLIFALRYDAAAIADQAIDQRYVCAESLAFDEVGLGHVLRHEDVRFDACCGGVSG